jgi:hypothetical protein
MSLYLLSFKSLSCIFYSEFFYFSLCNSVYSQLFPIKKTPYLLSPLKSTNKKTPVKKSTEVLYKSFTEIYFTNSAFCI